MAWPGDPNPFDGPVQRSGSALARNHLKAAFIRLPRFGYLRSSGGDFVGDVNHCACPALWYSMIL